MNATDTTPDDGPVEITSFTPKDTKTRRYRAWCHHHQDGYQGGKAAANNWADKHLKDEHPEEAK